MRANAQRVIELESQFIKEILDWFGSQPDLDAIEFKRSFVIQVDVDDTFLDYDLGTEDGTIIQMVNDGTILLEDGREIGIDELNPYDLAFILDEIADKQYKEIKLETEN